MPKPQRDPHAPKRAQSSYLLYQNAHREQFKAEVSLEVAATDLFLMHMMCSYLMFNFPLIYSSYLRCVHILYFPHLIYPPIRILI